MRKFTAALATLALLVAPTLAEARGGGGGSRSSGGGASKSSSSPKSSGGSSKSAGTSSAPSKTSTAGAKSYSQSKSSLRQPSSGPVKQPAPLNRLVPATPPRPRTVGGVTRRFNTPPGRNQSRDRAYINRHREHANPYYGGYMGMYDSPFFYMWMFSMMDDDNGNNPAPPQADEGEIALIIPTEFKLLAEAMKPAAPVAATTGAATDAAAQARDQITQATQDPVGQAKDKLTEKALEQVTP